MSGLLAHRGLLLGAAIASGWDAGFLAATVSLSNGNRTASASGGGANGATRATQSRSSGKRYFEVIKNATGAGFGPSIGVGNGSMTTAAQIGDNANSWGLLQDGRKYHSGSATSYGSSIANTDVVMVAVDIGGGFIWWGKNGSWFASGDPAAGTNAAYSDIAGTIYPSVSPGDGGSATASFDTALLAYAPPSGFTAWGE